MTVPILVPPVEVERFVEQTYDDEEWLRASAGGVTYVRGKHGGYDLQAPVGERTLYAVCDAVAEHHSFGPALGVQTVLRLSSGEGVLYAHQASRLVGDGVAVRTGQPVGTMGDTSTNDIGVHLHLETLRTWNNWYSTYNCGPQLRTLKGAILANIQQTFDAVKELRQLVIDLTVVVLTGTPRPGSALNSAFWSSHGAHSLRALRAALDAAPPGSGASPAEVKAALKEALREGVQ